MEATDTFTLMDLTLIFHLVMMRFLDTKLITDSMGRLELEIHFSTFILTISMCWTLFNLEMEARDMM